MMNLSHILSLISDYDHYFVNLISIFSFQSITRSSTLAGKGKAHRALAIESSLTIKHEKRTLQCSKPGATDTRERERQLVHRGSERERETATH